MLYLTQKIKIRPNNKQIDFFNKCIHSQRFLYNQMLSLWNNEYAKGNKPNKRNIRDLLRKNIKNNLICDQDGVILDTSFLNELPGNLIETACEHLGRAFDNFFKTKKGFPKFKSKRNEKLKFTIYRKNDSTFKYDSENDLFSFTKFPFKLKLKEKLKCNVNDIKSMSISKEAYGWYISITYKYEFQNKLSNINRHVGIDLGIKDFAILSETDDDGKPLTINFKDIINYKRLLFLNKKLIKLNKVLSNKRCKNSLWKLSKIYEKVKTKLSLCYKRISNIKKDFLHKLTSFICKYYSHIGIENLKVKNLLKNRRLSKAIHESCFYTFRSMLEYKSNIYGCKLVLAPSNYPSTQTCSCCGNVLKGNDKLSLKDRMYSCIRCNLHIDRDLNASLNLRNLTFLN